MMWSEKYRPKHILDLIGNEESRKLFVEWFAKWKKGVKPVSYTHLRAHETRGSLVCRLLLE